MSKDNNAPDAEDSNPEIIEIVGLDDGPDGSDTAEPELVGVADEDDPVAVSGSRNLEDLRRENAEIQERLLRNHADVENMRKRMEREKAEFVRFAAVDLVRKLLPVIDNLERALEAPADTGGDGLREGVRLVHQELQSILEREGLKVVEAKGKPFDPNLHEAVLREESTEIDSEQVIEEFQKGFVFRDRLLRPAMVKVAVPAVAQERNEDDPPKPGVPVTDPKEG